jgi:hypothetical protein
MARELWAEGTRPTPDQPTLGWPGCLRPSVGVPWAMDRRDDAEPPLLTMRALLDIDAREAFHERGGRFGSRGCRRLQVQASPKNSRNFVR